VVTGSVVELRAARYGARRQQAGAVRIPRRPHLGAALEAVGPFVVRLHRKGDGRWDWKIFADGAESPLAAGVSTTLGAAKTKCEQFVTRSGRI